MKKNGKFDMTKLDGQNNFALQCTYKIGVKVVNLKVSIPTKILTV